MSTEKQKNTRTKKRKNPSAGSVRQSSPQAGRDLLVAVKASSKTKKQEIVYAFIDSQNLNLSIKSQGWDLDFGRLRIYLKDKYNVEKAFLFIGYIEKNRDLYKYLKKVGYTLIFKPILEYKRGRATKVKGNVDAELVLHTMIEYPNFNKAIIVSGDGDFYCLVEYLLKKNKIKRLLIPNRKKYSRLLFKFIKHIDFISNQRSKLEK